MGLPKKKNKNRRKLIYDEIEYYWRVEDDTRDFQGLIVTIGIVSHPFKRCCFDFRFDNEDLKSSSGASDSSLIFVTPKLVKEAIAFAKENYNWGKQSTCYFKFEKGSFQQF